MEERKADESDSSSEEFLDAAESSSSAADQKRQQEIEIEVTETKVKRKAKNIERSSSTPADLSFHKNVERIKINKPKSAKPEKQGKIDILNRGLIETAAPFESVKEVVTKYGGIIDWKAHKVHTLERHEYVRSELEKVQLEIPEYKRQSEVAEIEKNQVFKELEDAKKVGEELKIKLEKAQTEEAQANQDSELAQLRAKEVEQGIAGQSSTAVKAQKEIAKARQQAAVAELNSVNEELKILRRDYVSLINERDLTIRKAEEAVSKSKEVEKTVEELTLELIAMKESLESAQSAELEAEEQKVGAELVREQDSLKWQKELKLAEEKAQRLNQKILSKEDLQSKLDAESSLLLDLKAELAAYMKAKLNQESAHIVEESLVDDFEQTDNTQLPTDELTSTKKELEKVKASIEKTKEEVNCLRVAASTFNSQLLKEKEAVANLQQQEGVTTATIRSLAAELDRTKHELESVKIKEEEANEKMVELPKLLQKAALDAEKSKFVFQSAQAELQSVKDDIERAKASASTTETRLSAVLKEIKAAKASEQLAISAIKALQDSEHNDTIVCDDSTVSIPFDEYFSLSKKAHEAEEIAHERIEVAMAQVEAAKASEAKSIDRLVEAYKKMNGQKEALKVAMEKAEKANEEKMLTEHEHMKLRSAGRLRYTIGDVLKGAVNPIDSPRKSFDEINELKSYNKNENDVLFHSVPDSELCISDSNPETDLRITNTTEKKKLHFPQMFVFLAMRSQKQRRKGRT